MFTGDTNIKTDSKVAKQQKEKSIKNNEKNRIKSKKKENKRKIRFNNLKIKR